MDYRTFWCHLLCVGLVAALMGGVSHQGDLNPFLSFTSKRVGVCPYIVAGVCVVRKPIMCAFTFNIKCLYKLSTLKCFITACFRRKLTKPLGLTFSFKTKNIFNKAGS